MKKDMLRIMIVVRNTRKLELNSLYGKFAQKDQHSIIKIVRKSEAKNLTKRFNYQYITTLNNDLVLIKYSSRMNEKLRILYKNAVSQKDQELSGLFKMGGIPSAIQISAAISAYARISINKYKNIPGNKCYYSDTDSVILRFAIPIEHIGDDLGQMKLVYTIEEGILIRKKLYALITKEQGVVIKSSGVNSKKLDYNMFKELLSGKNEKP